LIAAPDLLPTLKERTGAGDGELLAFTDAEALKALEVITKRRPAVVALERLFAATPRGAALINRIKADPSLSGSEIRVISHDTEYTRVSARRPDPAPGGSGAAVAAVTAVPAAPLDQRGTRRAVRHKVAGKVDVLVDGNPATLVDVSTVGAQLVTGVVLKPNQRIRLSLPEGKAAIRLNASVAWAKFEIPPGSGPRYRAGVEFVNGDPEALAAYCARHKA
jgi:hypothetical protein